MVVDFLLIGFHQSSDALAHQISQSNALVAFVGELELLEPHNRRCTCASMDNADRLLDFDNHIPIL